MNLNIRENFQICISVPLSTYAKFSEKLTFLNPRYAHVGVRIRRLEMLVFRRILRTYLIDGPFEIVAYDCYPI